MSLLSTGVDYTICICTGSCFSAGTDADVRIRLRRGTSETDWVELDDPIRDDFEINNKDCFQFRAIRLAEKVVTVV